MTSRIPVELYRAIIEHTTDKKTLLSLALVSKILNVEAERALYNTISNVYDVECYARVLTHIITCPRVARLVRHLYIILRSYVAPEHPFFSLLPTALRALPQLKTLVFRGIGDCSKSTRLPLDSSYQLEYLDWPCSSPELPRLLAEQRSLRTLLNVQFDQASINDIPIHALPKLSVLSGNLAAIKSLLPGRHVKDLHWIASDEDHRDPDLGSWVTSLRELETLQLGSYPHQPPFTDVTKLGLIAEHLSNVRKLELFGVHPDDLGYVSQLPRLEELVLSSQWGSSASPVPLGDSATVMKLFAGTPALKCVHVAMPVYWPFQAYCQAYERWGRGTPRPDIINMGLCVC